MVDESKEDSNHFYPFKYAGIQDLFNDLLDSLFEESGRGALLIATAYVEDHLSLLIQAVFPGELSNSQKKELLNFPGPLSSFASKIKLAYAFRLINKNVYDCLNALRGIRNNAAHSAEKFELYTLNEKLTAIYNFGPGFSDFLQSASRKALIHSKIEQVKGILDESDLDDAAKQKIFNDSLKRMKKLENMEKQVPFWELVYGLTYLCAIIAYHRERIATLTKDINSLSDFTRIRQNLPFPDKAENPYD